MSSTELSNQGVPEVILRKLNRLRRKLTSWILVHGLGRWLLILLAILAFDMLVDRAFKMDFSQRLIMLVAMLAVAGFFFLIRVLRPLAERPTTDALIYEVEDKNKDLNQSLISSVQLARQNELRSIGMSQELAKATIDQAVAKAEGIDFSGAINNSKHVSNLMILGAGLLTLGGLAYGVAQQDFFRTWFNRNVLLTDDAWPQATYLQVAGVNEQGQLMLPRGADRRQMVFVTENSRVKEVDVSLEIETSKGRTVHNMKPTGKLDGREHAFMFHNVSSEFRFRASGGDDTTEWIHVVMVEPPSIAGLKLEVRLPEYTGMKSAPLEGSGPHSVLVGSRIAVSATANKPLQSCVIKHGDQVFSLEPLNEEKTQFAGVFPEAEQGPLTGGQYEFDLIDDAGLGGIRPSKFSISIKEDTPPKVRASLLGISGLVVPRAMIPVSFNASDEYAIAQMFFDCNWKTNDEEAAPGKQKVGFGALVEPGEALPRELRDVKVLDLVDLKLEAGTSFRLSVKALDNCPGKPGEGKSQEFLLRIVTAEELREDLLLREIEQRKAFEQAYNAQMALSAELQAVVAMKAEGQPVDEFNSERETKLIALVREQKLIGTSVDQVASRFEEFLVEVKNNRLDEKENELAPEQTIERRFDDGIIQPIRRLDSELIALAARHMDNCRRLASDAEKLIEAADPAVVVQNEILAEMKKILDSMNNSENFQEIINKLLDIKDGEEKLKMAIEKRASEDQKDLFDQDDEDDIFDKDN